MPDVYGSSWGDTLFNRQIGGAGEGAGQNPRIAYRFRATRSSALNAVLIYVIRTGAGYAAGTGGDIVISIQAESAGVPSGVDLAAETFVGASTSLTSSWPLITFASPATLVAGAYYYVVFTNIHATPDTNFISANPKHVYDATPTLNPRYGNDWRVLAKTVSGAWTQVANRSPILELRYADGTIEGDGYMEFYPTAQVLVNGANMVRQTIVPTVTRIVSAVSVRLQRDPATGTSDLTVTLQDAAQAPIDTKTLPYNTFPTGTQTDDANNHAAVGRVAFSSARTLEAGATYYLRLSSPADTVFRAPLLRQGSGQGFSAPTYFGDGNAQSSVDSGANWANVAGVTLRDVQFAFEIAARRGFFRRCIAMSGG